jgi:hypothetical protein
MSNNNNNNNNIKIDNKETLMEEIRLLNEAIELERVRREESLSRNEALRAKLQGLGVEPEIFDNGIQANAKTLLHNKKEEIKKLIMRS